MIPKKILEKSTNRTLISRHIEKRDRLELEKILKKQFRNISHISERPFSDGFNVFTHHGYVLYIVWDSFLLYNEKENVLSRNSGFVVNPISYKNLFKEV
jgi:hypothetical protein